MLRDALQSLSFASRRLFRNWQVAALFSGICALLLAACYFFAVTKEATIGQLLLTLVLALCAILLFYTLQAMSVSYTRAPSHTLALIHGSLKNSWRLMIVTLPLLLLAWLIVRLASQPSFRDLPGIEQRVPATGPPEWLPASAVESAGQSVDWGGWALTSLRLTFFAVVLPLAAIHLWISATRDGVRQTLRQTFKIMARAFRPQPVLIYTLGFILFGLVPCLLLFTRTPASNAWVEVGLLTMRLALCFLFLLFGWVITLGALARTTVTKESAND